jgi:hypothetical protein
VPTPESAGGNKGTAMKRWLLGLALAAVCTTALAAELRITNESLWDIHRIYLSSADDPNWGPDQLEEDILESGGTLRLHGVACDTYDIKLIDEDGDVCEMRGVKLCGDKVWTITNDSLLSCQNET